MKQQTVVADKFSGKPRFLCHPAGIRFPIAKNPLSRGPSESYAKNGRSNNLIGGTQCTRQLSY